MSIRSGSRPSRCARRTAASTSTVDLPVPGAPGIRTGPEPWRDVDGGELVRRQHRHRAVLGPRRQQAQRGAGAARVPDRGRRPARRGGATSVRCGGGAVGWCCGVGGRRILAGDAHTVISSSGTDNLCDSRSSRSAMASIRSKSASVGAHRPESRSTRQRPSPVRRKFGIAAQQRRAFLQVQGQGLVLLARRGVSAGLQDPPPGHGAAVVAHDGSDLARAAGTEEFGNVAIGHRGAGGDQRHQLQHRLHILRPHRSSLASGGLQPTCRSTRPGPAGRARPYDVRARRWQAQ